MYRRSDEIIAHGMAAVVVDCVGGVAAYAMTFNAVATIPVTALVSVIVYGLLARYTDKPAPETRCRKCGYILRGITEPRCPECGERI